MDYFSITILIIVVFVFMSDKKTKKLKEIIAQDKKIIEKIDKVNSNIEIIKLSSEDITYESLINIVEKSDKEYVLIQNNKVKLNKKKIKELIANYITGNVAVAGFNLMYDIGKEKTTLKKLYVDLINYLNIFNKYELNTYGVIICKRQDALDESTLRKNLVSFSATKNTTILLNKKEIKKEKISKIYMRKLTNSNISIIIKMLLLIFSGSIITTNLIYAMFNIKNNITNLILATIIYYCYSYVIRYIYKPIGKKRIIASYIFPIYFIAYVCVGIYTLICKVIKKVQVS